MDTVFYSWQSDLPNGTNRGFIQAALEAAAKAIRDDDSIHVEPVVDRDTAGVPGSPDISSTILEKIDHAQVFVCDVSIINHAEITPQRLTPNPNVLIELGYALKALGQQRVIMVMNTVFGSPEQLPFDLRLKRVLAYTAPIEATERAPERRRVQSILEASLRAIFAAPRRRANQEESHDHRLFRLFLKELPSTGSVGFIKTQNMAGFAFPWAALEQLNEFWHVWTDADHEFIDIQLEAGKQKLFGAVNRYMNSVVGNTFPANREGYQTVPPEWEEDRPAQFWQVVKELHELAEQVVDAHQQLVRLGKEKLGISLIT